MTKNTQNSDELMLKIQHEVLLSDVSFFSTSQYFYFTAIKYLHVMFLFLLAIVLPLAAAYMCLLGAAESRGSRAGEEEQRVHARYKRSRVCSDMANFLMKQEQCTVHSREKQAKVQYRGHRASINQILVP